MIKVGTKFKNGDCEVTVVQYKHSNHVVVEHNGTFHNVKCCDLFAGNFNFEEIKDVRIYELASVPNSMHNGRGKSDVKNASNKAPKESTKRKRTKKV